VIRRGASIRSARSAPLISGHLWSLYCARNRAGIGVQGLMEPVLIVEGRICPSNGDPRLREQPDILLPSKFRPPIRHPRREEWRWMDDAGDS
jgi:hypothetical protein